MDNRIAIIGISMRCAEADSMEELGENLKNGRDSVRPFDEERIRNTSIDTSRPLRQIGFMDDIDKFDYRLFGISKAEACAMDPHHRLLLELTYEAIEDTGYSTDYFDGSKTSVYLSDINPEYYKLADTFEEVMIAGNSPAFAAARVARQFNLTGNALVVDTACSSSLVALNTACNELILGDTDYAVVGGASLNFFPYCDKEAETSIWSSDGKSRAFSQEADGMSCGETAGCCILKRYEDALRDNDNIQAVILASAVNNNANRSSSPSAPDSISQANVIVDAWKKAGINPEELGFIEAHGSGTQLGDTLEIEGLDKAFRQYTDQIHICPISTIKSNIGHSYSMSGLAAIAKVVLSLKNEWIYPSIHIQELNRMIDFEHSSVYVQRTLKEWKKRENQRRLAGITSLGASGTNCHVIMEEAPVQKPSVKRGRQIITISSMFEEGVKSVAEKVSDYLEGKGKEENLYDIACNLNIGRHHYKKRIAVAADNTLDIAKKLRIALEQYQDKNMVKEESHIFFVLGDCQVEEKRLQEFAAENTIFESYFDKCRKIKQPDAYSANECTFVFEYALYHVLKESGLEMSSCICTGIGKTVLGAVTGQKTLEEAFKDAGNYAYEEKDYKQNIRKLIAQYGEEDAYTFIFIGSDGVMLHDVTSLAVQNENISTIAVKEYLSDYIVDIYLAGLDLDWMKFYGITTYRHMSVPRYSFRKDRSWIREGTWIQKKKEFTNEKTSLLAEFNTMELAIRNIWVKVLDKEINSTHDSFFDCGGDSLLATKVIRDLEKLTGVQLDFEDMFDFQTIEQMSEFLLSHISLEKKIVMIYEEVLKIKDITEEDSFFELGGHSLMANQLLHKLADQLHITLNFEDVFNQPTAKKLAAFIRNHESQANVLTRYPIGKAKEQSRYVASEVQKQLWLLSKVTGGNEAYNSPFQFTVDGTVDYDIFAETVSKLQQRHESLRTIFAQEGEEVYQTILPDMPKEKIIEKVMADSKEQCQAFIDEDIMKPFHLENGPLLRCKVFYVKNQTIIYFNIHHIVHDGWSSKVFLNDFISIYNSLAAGTEITLPPLKIQYKDYAEWQKQMFQEGHMDELAEYWMSIFKQKTTPLDLMIAKKRPAVRRYEGEKVYKIIRYDLMNEIKKHCNQDGMTLYMYLFTALDILLYFYSKNPDIVIGTPIAGRNQEILENQIGYYANTVAIRNWIEEEASVGEILNAVKQNILGAFKHQDYPFGRLVKDCKCQHENGRNPLFDVMMVLQNTNMVLNQKLSINGMAIEDIKDLGISSLFDLHFEFIEEASGISLGICYDKDLFEKPDIEDMGDNLVELLGVMKNKNTLVKDIALTKLPEDMGIANWEMDDLLSLLNQ